MHDRYQQKVTNDERENYGGRKIKQKERDVFCTALHACREGNYPPTTRNEEKKKKNRRAHSHPVHENAVQASCEVANIKAGTKARIYLMGTH